MNPHQTVSSFTKDYPTFMAMVRAFGAGEPFPCVDCDVTGTRLLYLYTTAGKFLWGRSYVKNTMSRRAKKRTLVSHTKCG